MLGIVRARRSAIPADTDAPSRAVITGYWPAWQPRRARRGREASETKDLQVAGTPIAYVTRDAPREQTLPILQS